MAVNVQCLKFFKMKTLRYLPISFTDTKQCAFFSQQILLSLLATSTARPDPQLIYNVDPFYGISLSAYTAPAPAPVAPIAPVAPVVPATVPAPVLPMQSVYPGQYPSSSVYTYAYGYQSTFGEVPSSNLVSAYSSVPYSNVRYSSLPYTSVPYAYLDYLSYRR